MQRTPEERKLWADMRLTVTVTAADAEHANENGCRIVLVRPYETPTGLGIRPFAVHDCPHMGLKSCAFTSNNPDEEALVCENLRGGGECIAYCCHTFYSSSEVKQEPADA
jgi:hypothetical protein